MGLTYTNSMPTPNTQPSPTPLQLIAEYLTETAQNSAELANAYMRELDANERAENMRNARKVVAVLTACPVMRNTRTREGRCVR